jgi:hypothetical protein
VEGLALKDGKLTLSIESVGRNRRPIIAASVNGEPLHRDGLSIDDAGERRAFIQAIRAKCPGACPDELEAELLSMAATLGKKADSESSPLKPRLLRMSDVEAKPIRWLWPNRIAAGRLSLLVGMPGVGKSYLTADMAARITTGRTWPDGSTCEPGSVLLMTAEDDPSDTIRPRLDAHGADVSRVHVLTGAYSVDADDDTTDLMISLGHVDIIEAALREIGDCRLVVIDPIGSFLGGRTDSHRDNEVRSVLAPIGKLAEKYGPAVLAIAHRRKSVGNVADDMALGSRAFTGLARSVWHLSRDADDATRRLLLPGKNNLAPEADGLAFCIAGSPGMIWWENDPVTITADEALAKEHATKDGNHSAMSEAEAWLRDSLSCGPVKAKEIKDAARRDGIADRTLDRAANSLGVVRGPGSWGGPWVWSWPADAGTPAGDSLASLVQSRQESNSGETDQTVPRLGTDTDDEPDHDADSGNHERVTL